MALSAWKIGVGAALGTFIGNKAASMISGPTASARQRIIISGVLQCVGGFLAMKYGFVDFGAGMIGSGIVNIITYGMTAGTSKHQGGDALLNGAAAALGLPSTDAATAASTASITAMPLVQPVAPGVPGTPALASGADGAPVSGAASALVFGNPQALRRA